MRLKMLEIAIDAVEVGSKKFLKGTGGPFRRRAKPGFSTNGSSERDLFHDDMTR